ncbi:RNA polymerase sigma factor [Levilactobacillus fuyuanensis]|uniref:RNA polymerase sigma factor n=1 Tax=Levilactobacillus fuyuanensis TaxID=2486022 RepID=A0ABW4GZB1_9LACO|nr:RNA polymerase sigma factor [Levilactobacillus fuyuanensis]
MQLRQYEDLLAQLAVELQRYLMGRGAQREVAEDICQDVFVKVLEMELVLPPDELRPYLYRVAWSTYLDDYRRKRRYRELVTQYLRPEREQVDSEVYEDLLSALDTLPEHDRELLLLRYNQELSIREVAVCLKVRPAAIKMRLHRVHRKLKKILRRGSHGRK